MPLDGWIDEQNVMYAHNKTLLSLKKEWNSDVPYPLDDLENIMNQPQKDKRELDNYHMILSTWDN